MWDTRHATHIRTPHVAPVAGQKDGLVVDSGLRYTRILPIIDLTPMSHAAAMLPLGGEDVTRRMVRACVRVWFGWCKGGLRMVGEVVALACAVVLSCRCAPSLHQLALHKRTRRRTLALRTHHQHNIHTRAQHAHTCQSRLLEDQGQAWPANVVDGLKIKYGFCSESGDLVEEEERVEAVEASMPDSSKVLLKTERYECVALGPPQSPLVLCVAARLPGVHSACAPRAASVLPPSTSCLRPHHVTSWRCAHAM